MHIVQLAAYLTPQNIHLISLLIVFLVTWSYTIKGDWIIDDVDGIWQFGDRFNKETGERVDWYEQEIEKGGKKEKLKIKNRQFNRHINFPGSVVRFIRLNLGAKWQQLGKNKKGHEIYGYVQSAYKHHAINLAIHLANTFLLYFFLQHIVPLDVAFIATLFFVVHPVACQSVAWISGIGYLLCLMMALISFNIPFWIPNLAIQIPLICITTWLSASFLLAGMANFVILAVLGFWWAALGALAVAIFCFVTQGLWVKNYRVKAFTDQNMGKSTKMNWRKPIIMLKSFFYYVCMTLFPKRLGLYHEWGYHYDDKLERFDLMALAGLASLIGLGALFWFGPLPVKLGVAWFTVYVGLFLNLITAQQTVADRYVFIASLGFCLVVAFYLASWPLACAFLLGLMLMRTWTHLPSFDNQVKFYQSNMWNFPKSEVALGNLGTIYKQAGMHGMAEDSWRIAAHINPNYDVPWYNLYSSMKVMGYLPQAREYLKKCLDAKICHFEEQWTKELAELDRVLQIHQPIHFKLNDVNRYILEATK